MKLELEDIKQFFYERPALKFKPFIEEVNNRSEKSEVSYSTFQKLLNGKNNDFKYSDRLKEICTKEVLPVMIMYGWDFSQRPK